MPRGPKGEKRKADVIGNAVHIMRIATGQVEDVLPKTRRAEGGKAGGPARAQALSPNRRSKVTSMQ
jgi:hypothetical protein